MARIIEISIFSVLLCVPDCYVLCAAVRVYVPVCAAATVLCYACCVCCLCCVCLCCLLYASCLLAVCCPCCCAINHSPVCAELRRRCTFTDSCGMARELRLLFMNCSCASAPGRTRPSRLAAGTIVTARSDDGEKLMMTILIFPP